MRGRNQVILIVAIVLGLFAAFLANTFLSGVESRQERVAETARTAKVVVAASELPFGATLGMQNLRLVNWPGDSIPAGSFSSIDELIKVRRAVLRPLSAGEPILASRISGPNGRATLGTSLPDGKLAFAIPLSEVSGVGGFVRPGDSVDVLLTRQIPGPGATADDKMTDVVMESVPVLAVDQVADAAKTDPAVGRTATLEVDTIGAQKLALARELGVLSLALRNVSSPATGPHKTVVPRQLTASGLMLGAKLADAGSAKPATPPAGRPNGLLPFAPRPLGPSMLVIRGTESTTYEVPRAN